MNLDWHTIVGSIGVLILLCLLVPYVRSTFHGTTRPSAVSWLGWALLFVIETVAQASKGIDWSLAVPLISTVSTTVITIIAFRYGKVIWTRADRFCIALAVLAIIGWAFTSEPLVAIILAIAADLAVTVPTVVKTYEEPDSEPLILWSLYVFACVLAIVATRSLTIYNLLGPIYTALGSFAIAIFARGKLSR